MENKVIVFFQESSQKNTSGSRKIQVKQNTYYTGSSNVAAKVLKTFDNMIDAGKWIVKKGFYDHCSSNTRQWMIEKGLIN
ncbi:hypothetical protein [Paenibacillus cremeus]|uniref:Uncharacterized protein n=1 Tax=Paenibacillus cremeus TaxID=2163881 RepID=A0A559KCP8_9BACL|nr:hypothetical protein [Paenibacillus cremeus]TVY09916.1 hypothetical protein FPZ49_11130 [Paenibacillus cremeus]